MTLQQLKYVVAVAECGSLSEAAGRLFVAQPSLSAAVKELEKETRTAIFQRTGRGMVVTPEGETFLGYARQVLQQAELLEARYISGETPRQRFTVSTQHYTFTASAFVDLIREFGGDEYDFTLRETTTWGIIEDVKNLRSELGVLYLSDFNRQVLEKLMRDSKLKFTGLFTVPPHVFLSRDNPLAKRERVTLEDLEDLPCLTFDQGEHSSFYFSEEILSTHSPKKRIRVTDRAAVINLLIGVGGYAISTGVFPAYLHGGDGIVAVPLEVNERIQVGVVTHRDYLPTRLGEIYLAALRRIGAEAEAGTL
ncbi:LysR family transcriptional regulator [Ruminococcaceae bacterium OttesenSCG-928-D13]|nr:LysR family transcriptional regulator [Ruminococcaceae bacterium OttesenSCG-928-D13]